MPCLNAMFAGGTFQRRNLLSALDQIKKLAELRGAGIITEREYHDKKKKLFQKI
jgi:hypothetical protein